MNTYQQETQTAQAGQANRTKRIWIIAALALIGAGLCISVCAMLALGFDFTKLNTMNYVTNTYTVNEEFSSISVDGAECDIRLLASEDSGCKVVCTEGENISHSVTVENGTLSIERHDRRKWHMYFGVYWGSMEILIYLPQSEFDELHAQSVSGDIEVPEDFSFTTADLRSTSGDIRFLAAVEQDLSADTTSGDIALSDIQCRNAEIDTTSGNIRLSGTQCQNAQIDTTSGDIQLSEIQCQNAEIGTTSGSVRLTDLTAAEAIHAQSVSGNLTLQRCDAASLWFSSTSGDIFGSLLTEKQFEIDTTSGDIRVPDTSWGGTCKASTVSGDIEFSILP